MMFIQKLKNLFFSDQNNYNINTGSINNLIDVKELIKKLDDETLIRSADQYWNNINTNSDQCYKPFSSIFEIGYLPAHLSLLFSAASLFKNANVLDFGCATGWLTNALADAGVNAYGVDISEQAITLSKKLREYRALRPGVEVITSTYDGKVIPFKDNTFDRIVCFDSFHHVRDQNLTLQEFYRVLKPGGRVAMLEPAPNHSLSPHSQYEMKNYNVIENDINSDVISDLCFKIGFSNPQMLLQLSKPINIEANKFNGIIKTDKSKKYFIMDKLKDNLDLLNGPQCFYFTKNYNIPTSVNSDGCAAEFLEIKITRIEEEFNYKVSIKLKNTGKNIWLSRSNEKGKVNLGVKLISNSGSILDHNFNRQSISDSDILPGDIIDVNFMLYLNQNNFYNHKLLIDVVSEEVMWFNVQNTQANNIINLQDV